MLLTSAWGLIPPITSSPLFLKKLLALNKTRWFPPWISQVYLMLIVTPSYIPIIMPISLNMTLLLWKTLFLSPYITVTTKHNDNYDTIPIITVVHPTYPKTKFVTKRKNFVSAYSKCKTLKQHAEMTEENWYTHNCKSARLKTENKYKFKFKEHHITYFKEFFAGTVYVWKM